MSKKRMVSAVVLVTLLLTFSSIGGCICVVVFVTCCKPSPERTKEATATNVTILIENPDDTKSIGVKV